MKDMETELPDILFIQMGDRDNQDLFVNRSEHGALNQNLGENRVPGSVVGVYKLEKIVRVAVGVIELAQVEQIASPKPETKIQAEASSDFAARLKDAESQIQLAQT